MGSEGTDGRTDGEPAALGRVWPHVRAALVLFHLASACVLSIPASGAMRDISAWRAPHAARELEVWGRRARDLGFDLTQAEFERWLWDLSTEYLEVRDTVAAPFSLYARYSGALQGWSMFANPQTEPAWLAVEVRDESGDFQTIYVERSADRDWMARQLDHNRMRKLQGRLGRGAYDAFYRGLVDWLARRAAADFPEATHLRARVERRRTPDPSDDSEIGYQGSRHERELVVPLEPLR